MFRKNTCCDVSHSRKLASTGEASQDCLRWWELSECSICDTNVGVVLGPPTICASFCKRLFQACSGAYFSIDAKIQVLEPCGVNDFLCGRASEWISNGTELCRAAGFIVEQYEDSGFGVKETNCYGGRANLDSVADSWKDFRAGPFRKNKPFEMVDDFHQWVREMSFSERVSWAVGALVLTAGLFFMSKRKSYHQIQKQAAILGTARRLETRVGRGKRR